MYESRIRLFGFLLALSFVAGPAYAQSSSLFGGSGATAQGAAAGRATSATGFGGTGMGTGTAGGFNANSVGTNMQNAMNGTQFSGLTNLGQASATVGQGGFLGAGNTQGRFVGGRTATGQQGTQLQQGLGQAGLGLNRNQNGQNRNNQANRNNQNQANNNFNLPGGANSGAGAKKSTLAAPQQKIAFNFQTVRAEEIGGKIQRHLQNNKSITAPGTQSLAAQFPIGIQMDDAGIVTLTGTVNSDDNKRLIEALVRLEPGVRKVVSEIAVEPAPTAVR